MFEQFTKNLSGNQIYLISSMGVFVIFFIVVTVMLIILKKTHVEHMSELPLEDSNPESPNQLQS